MLEWKKLGGIANLVRGKVISKDYIRDHEGLYPVYSSQTANNGILGCIDSYMFDGDFLTWTTDGAYAGTIFRRKGKFNITNVCGLVDLTDKQVNQDFLYYWLSFVAKDYVNEGMGNPKLMSNVASTIRIPIPSLAEQTRIVGILDTFTASIENLKQQIAQRRKQYEHYRDQLLDLEGKEGVEEKRIGDISFISDYVSNGSFASLRENVQYKIEPDYAILVRVADYSSGFDKSKFVYIDEHAYDFLSKSALYGGEIIMSNVGSCGLIFRCPKLDRKMSLAPNAILIKSDHIDYLYYWLGSNKGQEEIKKITSKSAMPKFNKTEFKKITIPIPSTSEQSRIVSILDTFEAAIANLEQQLVQREKQYEYYRNKLLTFE